MLAQGRRSEPGAALGKREKHFKPCKDGRIFNRWPTSSQSASQAVTDSFEPAHVPTRETHASLRDATHD